MCADGRHLGGVSGAGVSAGAVPCRGVWRSMAAVHSGEAACRAAPTLKPIQPGASLAGDDSEAARSTGSGSAATAARDVRSREAAQAIILRVLHPPVASRPPEDGRPRQRFALKTSRRRGPGSPQPRAIDLGGEGERSSPSRSKRPGLQAPRRADPLRKPGGPDVPERDFCCLATRTFRQQERSLLTSGEASLLEQAFKANRKENQRGRST